MGRDEDTVTVSCSGALCLSRAEEVRDTILAAFERSPSVTIDCSLATEVDLSFIQLILAARLSAERRGGSVRLKSPPDGALATSLRAAGLTGGPLTADSQFWTEGK